MKPLSGFPIYVGNVELTENVLLSLQADLRSVCAEAKKKFPLVKEAAEKAILQLRSLSDSPQTNYQAVVADLTEVPAALILACQTNNPNLIKISLACLNKLISFNAISKEGISTTVDLLFTLLDSHLELIRVCQIVNTLLTGSYLVKGKILAGLCSVCFKLYMSNDVVISNTAAASLRQFLTISLERADKEIADSEFVNSNEFPLSSYCSDILLFLKDLCHIIRGEELQFVEHAPVISAHFSLELIETALASYEVHILKTPSFEHFIKTSVCPMIISDLFHPSESTNANSNGKITFPLFVRLLRIMKVLMENFFDILPTECEVFFTILVKYLDEDQPLWKRAVTAEVLNNLCGSATTLRALCQLSAADIIVNSFIAKLAEIICSVSYSDSTNQLSDELSYRKQALLDLLDKLGPSSAPPDYFYSLCVSCMLNIFQTADVITRDELKGRLLGSPTSIHTDSDKSDPSFSIGKYIIKLSWSLFLKPLVAVAEETSQEQMLAKVFNAFETVCQLAAIVELPKVCESYLLALYKFVVPAPIKVDDVYENEETCSFTPPNETPILTQKNKLAAHVFLNIVEVTYKVLDTSWLAVLLRLQVIDYVITKSYKLLPLSGADEPTETAELSEFSCTQRTLTPHELLDRIPRFLSATSCFSSTSFERFLEVFFKLTSTWVSSTFSNRAFASSLFFTRLLIVCCANVERISSYWPKVLSFLRGLSRSETSLIRVGAVETLSKFVHFLLKSRESRSFDCSSEVLEENIFSGLRTIGSEYLDTQERQLECLQTLLQTFGQSLCVGWPYILEICCSFSFNDKNFTGVKDDKVMVIRNIRAAFESLQLTVTDFLSVLPNECLYACMESVGFFGTQKLDVNISLTAVGLLWNIADYLHTGREAKLSSFPLSNNAVILEEIENDAHHVAIRLGSSMKNSYDSLWITLFSQLAKLCVDQRPEVRKSSNQTLFETLRSHGIHFSTDVWLIIFWEVLFPLFVNVQDSSEDAAGMEQPPAVNLLFRPQQSTIIEQWDETKIDIIKGTTSLFEAHTAVIYALPSFHVKWRALLHYMKSFALLPSKAVSHRAMIGYIELVKSLDSLFGKSTTHAEGHGQPPVAARKTLWNSAWQTWACIFAMQSLEAHVPLANVFPLIYKNIRSEFARPELCVFFKVCREVVLMDIHFWWPTYSNKHYSRDWPSLRTSSFQSSVFKLLCLVVSPVCDSDWPFIFSEWLYYLSLGYQESVNRAVFGNNFCQNNTDATKKSTDNGLCNDDLSDNSEGDNRSITNNHNSTAHKLLSKHAKHDMKTPNKKKKENNNNGGRQEKTAKVLNRSPSEIVQEPSTFLVYYCSTFQGSILELFQTYYEEFYNNKHVVREKVLLQFIQTSRYILQTKYKFFKCLLWRKAVETLLFVANLGFLHIQDHTQGNKLLSQTWTALQISLELFFFHFKPTYKVDYKSLEEDEQLDILLIKCLIKNAFELLPHLSDKSLLAFEKLLRKASTLDLRPANQRTNKMPGYVREKFREESFNYFLSLAFPPGVDDAHSVFTADLIDFCSKTLIGYAKDSHFRGLLPLDWPRVLEVETTLRALDTIIGLFMEAEKETLKKKIILISKLYEPLVNCIGCNSNNKGIHLSLQRLLLKYGKIFFNCCEGE